jgi:hypothetical protein
VRDDLKGASRLLIGLCLVSLLAACGPLPRPFQPGGKAVTNETLSAPPAPETLSVSPVSGLLPEDGALAAELLAEELRRFNIAAAAAPGNSSSIYLDGRLTKDGLLWLISEADGTIRGTERQSLGAQGKALAEGDPAVLRRVMEAAAPLLITELSAAEAGGLPGHPGARLVIAPVEPAPEEAARLLGSSIRVALSQSALPIAEPEDAGPRDLTLQGSVRIGPAQSGQHRVDVVWELFDPEGNSLGRVSQGDLVPAQALSFFWPDTAPFIAEAAVDGVVDLLYRTSSAQ